MAYARRTTRRRAPARSQARRGGGYRRTASRARVARRPAKRRPATRRATGGSCGGVMRIEIVQRPFVEENPLAQPAKPTPPPKKAKL